MTRVIARRTVLRPGDAVGEAFTSIVARPLPATATSVAALLAVAWFVAILGLVSTVTGQVTSAFVRQLPTTIRITAPRSLAPQAPVPYPADVEHRIDAISGVVGSGVYWQVRLGQPMTVSARPQANQESGPGQEWCSRLPPVS